MRREGARLRIVVALLGATGAVTVASGCGEEDERFGDGKIVDALKLQETSDGYTVGGDPFCIISDRFFHDAGEVEAAKTDKDIGTVISSRAGNVAVEAVEPFAPDCADQARKRLNNLDPEAKEE